MTRMALHLFGYDLRAFARNRQWQFFTLALPVLFLVIFASVFGGRGHTTAVAGGQISTSVSYVPGIIALGVTWLEIQALLRPMQHSAVSGKGLNSPDVVMSGSRHAVIWGC